MNIIILAFMDVMIFGCLSVFVRVRILLLSSATFVFGSVVARCLVILCCVMRGGRNAELIISEVIFRLVFREREVSVVIFLRICLRRRLVVLGLVVWLVGKFVFV